MSKPPQDARDQVDVIGLQTASGTSVELMRTCFRTQTFPRHTHDYFTLGVVLRGGGLLWYRGAKHALQLGDVVVIPPGEVHTGEMGRASDVLSYFAVHVPPALLSMCADTDGGAQVSAMPDFPRAIVRSRVLNAALVRLNAIMQMRDAAEAVDDGAAEDALYGAVDLLLGSGAGPSRAHHDHEPMLVRTVRGIIAESYADNAQTSLRSLAMQAGVTPCHLVRVFTRTIGMSPHRYLVQTRVRHACEFLARGTPSSIVASMTGFVDQSHMTTQFKRFVGTTPASYQRGLAVGSGR